MDITPVVPGDRQLIQGYGEGGFRISGIRYEGSVLVFPSRVLDWRVVLACDLTADDLAAVAGAQPPPRILLLGCGPRVVPVKSEIRQFLRSAGVVVEAMDTGAACRTYNVLLAEERPVAAALIAV